MEPSKPRWPPPGRGPLSGPLLRAAREALGRASSILRAHPLVLAALVVGLGILLVMGKLVLGRRLLAADDIWTNDFINCNLPPKVFLGRSLRSGHVPLWMPGAFGGLPLLAQGEAGALNPLTWIFFLLPDWVTGANLSLAVHTALAGFGMVLLCRRFGLRLSAALVAALAFMFSGFLVEHAKHMNMEHAAVWAPWLILAADWMIEDPSPRTGAVLGVLAALQVTEGHPQMSYITLFALFPVLLFRMVEKRPWKGAARFWRRALGASALSLAVFVALSGAYLAASVELLSKTERSGRVNPWDFATHFEFFWENLATLGWAHVFGDGSNATYNPRKGMFWESWLYMGVVPCVAAALAILGGLVRIRSRRWLLLLRTLFWLALGAFSFGLMMGKHSVVYAAAFKVVPGLSWFRFHHRFALVLTLSVASLAALGVDWVVSGMAKWRGEVWAGRLGAVLVLGTLGDLAFFMTRHFNGAPHGSDPPATVKVIKDHAGSDPYRIYTLFIGDTHVEAFGKAHGWAGDTQPFVDQWAFLQPAANVLWDIEAANGYASLVPYDVAQVMGTQNVPGVLGSPATHSRVVGPGHDCKRDPPHFTGPCPNVVNCPPALANAFGAYNVRFVVSPGEFVRCQGWTLLDTIKSGPYTVRVYENERVMPRAYVGFGLWDVADAHAAGDALVQADFDPRREVVRVVGAPPPGVPPPTRPRTRNTKLATPCQYSSRGPGSATVTCTTDTPGTLVIAETLYPGREVRIDGKLAPTFPANGTEIGVALDAGTHEILLDYRPRYRWLVPISVLGWLAAAAAGLRAARRAWRAQRTANVGLNAGA